MTDKIDELVSIIIAESTIEEIRLIKDGLYQYLDVFDNTGNSLDQEIKQYVDVGFKILPKEDFVAKFKREGNSD